jgi:putative membrane protein
VTIVAQIATLVAAGVHLLAFVWESVLFRAPSVHEGIFRIPGRDVPAAHLWAVNVGFYNLFLGSGAIAGVVLWWAGHDTPGRTLVVYTCLFMFLAGIALAVSDRMALSRQRGDGVVGALSQSVPPLVALIALAIG